MNAITKGIVIVIGYVIVAAIGLTIYKAITVIIKEILQTLGISISLSDLWLLGDAIELTSWAIEAGLTLMKNSILMIWDILKVILR